MNTFILHFILLVSSLTASSTSSINLLAIVRPRTSLTHSFNPLDDWTLPNLEVQECFRVTGLMHTSISPHSANDEELSLFRKITVTYDDSVDDVLSIHNKVKQACKRCILLHGIYEVIKEGCDLSSIAYSDSDSGKVNSLRIVKSNVAVGKLESPYLSKGEIAAVIDAVIPVDCAVDDAISIAEKQTDQIRIYYSTHAYILCRVLAMGIAAPTNAGQGRRDPLPSTGNTRRNYNGILGDVRLAKFKHVYKTTMEPEIGFIMANFMFTSMSTASIDESYTILDPFCGIASLLLYATVISPYKHVTVTVGSDSNISDSAVDHIHENFNKFNVVSPRHLLPYSIKDFDAMYDPSVLFNAIIADPPYEMKEVYTDADTSGSKDAAIKASITSLLTLCSKRLKANGRCCFFLPKYYSYGTNKPNQLTDAEVGVTQFACLKMLQCIRQDFSPTFCRYLVVVERTADA